MLPCACPCPSEGRQGLGLPLSFPQALRGADPMAPQSLSWGFTLWPSAWCASLGVCRVAGGRGHVCPPPPAPRAAQGGRPLRTTPGCAASAYPPQGGGGAPCRLPPAPCPEHRGGSSRVSPRRGCGRRTGCLLLATRYAVCFLAFWRPGPWGLPSTPSTALQPRRTAPQPCAWRPVGLWGGLSPAAQPPSRLGEGAAPLRGEQKATNPLVLAKIISENIFCFMWENRYQSHGMLYFILVVFENILIFGNTKINNGVCCTWCGPRVLSGGRALPGLSRCRPRVSPRRGPSLGPRRGHHRKFLQCPFVSPAA